MQYVVTGEFSKDLPYMGVLKGAVLYLTESQESPYKGPLWSPTPDFILTYDTETEAKEAGEIPPPEYYGPVENLKIQAVFNQSYNRPPEPPQPPKADPVKKTRRSWTAAQKAQIVMESRMPGATVLKTAEKYSLTKNLIFKWRQIEKLGF